MNLAKNMTVDQTIDTARLRTIASHERNNAALTHTVEALRDALRGQDAEVQALRAENTRLTLLLQARQVTPPLLSDAIKHLDVGDRYLAGQRLMEFAESELKRTRSEYGPEIVAITERMVERLSGDTGTEQ